MLGIINRNILVAGAAGISLLAGASYVTGMSMGEIVHEVSTTVRGSTVGYDAEGCKKDPVGCLSSQGRKLEATRVRVEEALGQVRPAAANVRELIRTQEAKEAQTDLFLVEGRRLIKTALSPTSAISFIGATYPSSEALTRQLRLIFAERERMEKFLATARTQLQALETREQDLLVARGSVASQLAMIPAQIELARAAGVLAGFDETLRSIDVAVAGGETPTLGIDAMMRDTSQLMKDQAAQPPAQGAAGPTNSDASFEAFMNGAAKH